MNHNACNGKRKIRGIKCVTYGFSVSFYSNAVTVYKGRLCYLLRILSSCVVGTKGPGKHPQLMPSTPRWAVANGAAVILSVCDDEVARYETADLTAAAVPALLLPPPATALDQHLVAGLPPLEPFARLFHR
mgnify:FL=1